MFDVVLETDFGRPKGGRADFATLVDDFAPIGRKVRLLAGLNVEAGSFAALAREIEIARRAGLSGVVLFAYRTLVDRGWLAKLKADVDRPLAAILSLNTIAHTVGAMGAVAEEIAPALKPGATVSDVGSVKRAVIEARRPGNDLSRVVGEGGVALDAPPGGIMLSHRLAKPDRLARWLRSPPGQI